MEIIRIGEHKLKLILSDEDLEKYNLKFDTLDYDNTKTRRVLWSILDDAKEKTGFDTAAERTLVQAYPGRKGGCEIYVTRQNVPTLSPRKRSLLYRFEDELSLFSACKAFPPHEKEFESSLYFSADGVYFLKIDTKEGARPSNLCALSPLSFLEEYGTRAKSEAAACYIKEHAACLISRDAIEKLAAYAASSL